MHNNPASRFGGEVKCRWPAEASPSRLAATRMRLLTEAVSLQDAAVTNDVVVLDVVEQTTAAGDELE